VSFLKIGLLAVTLYPWASVALYRNSCFKKVRVKFVEGCLDVMLLKICEFCQYLCYKRYTPILLKGVIEVFSVFSILFLQFGTSCFCVFLKIGQVKTKLLLNV
jgi:hypothetical protein